MAKQIEEEIRKIAKKIVNSPKTVIAVGDAALYIVDENFSNQGRPKWKAWSAAYAAARMRMPYPLLIGTRTGDLRNSIAYIDNGQGVTIYAAIDQAPYAAAFDSIRPIFTFPAGYSEIMANYIARAFQ